MKRKTMNQDVPISSLGETSQRSNEVMKNDPILESKHKIFLSHSGAQKEFVDHLCKALEDWFYYPFFDRRHESLPKGEQFAELIVRAAQQCEMLIVVVSDEYFMSKWPMIELSAFVQSHKLHCQSKSSTFGPKILPLFYGLLVDDLEDATLQKKWFEKWDTLAKSDPRNQIIVSDWKDALDVLKSFNGLPYDKKLKEVVAYIEKIISHVSKSILPEIWWDDSHVQGKSNICEVIGAKIQEICVSKNDKVKVVGIYGVGGIGKTMACHILYNEHLKKYKGRACHLEFPNVPWSDSKEFFQKVLQDLTSKSVDGIQCLDSKQCKGILRQTLPKQGIFLAIDNVSDSSKSKELAKTILQLPYHKDSVVVVTARSQSVLDYLGIQGDACLEMPDLGDADAMKLFLHHACDGEEFFQEDEKCDIMTCVRRCCFSKGDDQGFHYHPLALRALGLHMWGCGKSPSSWVKHLGHVMAFSSPGEENEVFDILRSGFNLLHEEDQTLFMDVGCFLYMANMMESKTLLSRLCSLHKLKEEEIKFKLEELKRKGMVQLVDLRFGRVTVHDLYVELLTLEAKGHFHKSTNLKERMWVVLESDDLRLLKFKPNGGCWDKLIRLFIKLVCMNSNNPKGAGEIGSLEGIDWRYFSNVEVLRFELQNIREDNAIDQLEHGALNLEGMTSLRVLELSHIVFVGGIEGLGGLKNLTHFTWYCLEDLSVVPIAIVGQFPSSLKLLEIHGPLVLESDALMRCYSLVNLNLFWVEALSLDLSNCQSLESVQLFRIEKLETLLGLGTYQSSQLQSLEVQKCKDLVDIEGIDLLIGLKKVVLEDNQNYTVPNLCALSELQVLKLFNLKGSNTHLDTHLDTHSNIDFMCNFGSPLEMLHWNLSSSIRGLNLNGCNQLEILDLRENNGLTSLDELGELLALRVLNLWGCENLLRLPNLSKSTKLEDLYLSGCLALELHKSDIQMLCELPFLKPLSFISTMPWFTFPELYIKLDFRRRKVLKVDVQDKWEEQDLDPLPILIKKLSPFQEEDCEMDSNLLDLYWL